MQTKFVPPYCPNSTCRLHLGAVEKFYVKNGSLKTAKPPHSNQRYRCKSCKSQFSENSFSIDFRNRKIGLSHKVLTNINLGMSNNSAAKDLKISERTIRKRIRQLSEQSIIFEALHFPKMFNEKLVFDGFETFVFDQYSPCYINTLVGSKSHFIYFNTYSPINRKGRMTPFQKMKNEKLQKSYGAYPKDSIFKETLFILEFIKSKKFQMTLLCDQHKSYLRAYEKISPEFSLHTISSKKRRTASNQLFPVNHLHFLYRHFMSSQHKETISFQKNEAGLMDKIQVMRTYRNYMNPKFIKKSKKDPEAHHSSPAMKLGVASKILNFNDIFQVRRLKTQANINNRDLNCLERNYPFSRRKILK